MCLTNQNLGNQPIYWTHNSAGWLLCLKHQTLATRLFLLFFYFKSFWKGRKWGWKICNIFNIYILHLYKQKYIYIHAGWKTTIHKLGFWIVGFNLKWSSKALEMAPQWSESKYKGTVQYGLTVLFVIFFFSIILAWMWK